MLYLLDVPRLNSPLNEIFIVRLSSWNISEALAYARIIKILFSVASRLHARIYETRAHESQSDGRAEDSQSLDLTVGLHATKRWQVRTMKRNEAYIATRVCARERTAGVTRQREGGRERLSSDPSIGSNRIMKRES